MHTQAKRWLSSWRVLFAVFIFVLGIFYLSSEERIVIDLEPLQVQNLSADSKRGSLKNTRLELTFDVQNRLESATLDTNYRTRLLVRGSGRLLSVSPHLDLTEPKCGLEAFGFRPIENSDGILEFYSERFPRVSFFYENGSLSFASLRFRDW